ncbi:hypothetical protein SLS63_009743 [Diaporthe eres]|uniref:Pectate lyase domain-containing protein n=1 Tax=Diaporthe eres TaxID=83184 RepID=A0ABR1NYR6_DIAER
MRSLSLLALAPAALGAPNAPRAAPVDALVGYGASATGGGSAAEAGGVIKISGVLDGCGIVDLVSDTSVIGVGAKSGLTNGGIRVKRAENVILRNLYLHNAPSKKDLVELQYSTNVWIDHNDFSSNGITGDKDAYDGLLDITHGSLVGHSDNNSGEDKGKLHITYHHNHFTNVNSRLPSVRFGTAHVYSSCYENNPTSGINSRMGAQVLAENNYFLNVPQALVTNVDSDEDGYLVNKDNVLINSTISITQVGSLSPPYSYTLDSADSVCSIVKASAGTGIVG